MSEPVNPHHDCNLCPRLHDFIAEQRIKYPDWHNGPVDPFGDNNARFMIAGLAPGLRGANQSGRPFTGDFAGDLLYDTIDKFGFSTGKFAARPDDGLKLKDCLIVNAVRCVPPQNKPTTAEIKTCNTFFQRQMAIMPNLQVILALGKIAHDAILINFGLVRGHYKFAHGAVHRLEQVTLIDSYHCSRYNTNTKRLTTEMFEDVFEIVRDTLTAPA
ncbi:Uracil-DNA glycosylase, family 5 [hydrothermal vent metagenome]|uniref:Type-5 uracil-DNA glycosylase n=1 Tax=hydrothermal vent metagenome TaxID=652676 RepID=A0A3B0R298_9ZZZZ